MLSSGERTLTRAGRLWRRWREEAPALLERASGIARAQWLFRGVTVGRHVCATGEVTVEAKGSLSIGAGVTFSGGMIPTRLTVGPGAELRVGDESIFNYAGWFEARRSIRIGQRCMFGSFVRIADALEGVVAPIVIGDDVWVAHGATIHPGVCLGDGSVVAAGSVVTQDVPARTMAVGNPARMIALREGA